MVQAFLSDSLQDEDAHTDGWTAPCSPNQSRCWGSATGQHFFTNYKRWFFFNGQRETRLEAKSAIQKISPHTLTTLHVYSENSGIRSIPSMCTFIRIFVLIAVQKKICAYKQTQCVTQMRTKQTYYPHFHFETVTMLLCSKDLCSSLRHHCCARWMKTGHFKVLPHSGSPALFRLANYIRPELWAPTDCETLTLTRLLLTYCWGCV